jgi:hypothetical protein
MAIIGYQILIAAIILICSFFGRTAYSIAVGGACLWTITHIFMPWLMVIQFITIGIASLIGYPIAYAMGEGSKGLYDFIMKKRLQWLEKQENKNDAYSTYRLGYKYEKGKGVNADREKAIYYYKKAKDLGHPEAEASLKRVEEGCFIVSVCYPESDLLVLNSYRAYRDDILMKRRDGRIFIKLYYRLGPYYAVYINSSPKLKSSVKSILHKIHDYYLTK